MRVINLEKALGGMGKCGKKDRKLELEFLQSRPSLRAQSCKGIFEKIKRKRWQKNVLACRIRKESCSVHPCLYFCFVYRVIITIFLNSICMH